MIFESDGVQDVINEISKAHTVREWLSIAWRIGFFIVILVYIKTIIRSIKYVIVSIWQAIVGKDKKLDTKELMGLTMWLTTIGLVIKYFYTSIIDISFFSIVVGYFCIMFGIENINLKKDEK